MKVLARQQPIAVPRFDAGDYAGVPCDSCPAAASGALPPPLCAATDISAATPPAANTAGYAAIIAAAIAPGRNSQR